MKVDIRQGYAEQRKAAYPPIEDQLDALWKGGAAEAEMRAKVAEVKARFPVATLPPKSGR